MDVKKNKKEAQETRSLEAYMQKNGVDRQDAKQLVAVAKRLYRYASTEGPESGLVYGEKRPEDFGQPSLRRIVENLAFLRSRNMNVKREVQIHPLLIIFGKVDAKQDRSKIKR